jgi:hypothetical protein
MGTKVNSNYEDLLTFTRASKGHALRPVSYGDEIINNGDFELGDNGDWGVSTNWTISGGVATLVGGDGVYGNSGLYQVIDLDVGKIYKVSLDVSGLTGTFRVYHASYSTGTNIDSTGTLVFNIVGESGGTRLNILGNNGSAVTLDNISVKEVLFDQPDGTLTLFEHPDNVPRVEFDAQRNRLGLLVEGARTNKVPYSNFSAGFSETRTTLTTDQAVSPDGTENAAEITETTDTGTHYISTGSLIVTASTSHTLSVFVKQGSGTRSAILRTNNEGADDYVVFDFATESITETGNGASNATSQSIGNDWYRISFTYTQSADTSSGMIVGLSNSTTPSDDLPSYTGDGSSSIFVYGLQFEQGSFSTSYIKNEGTSGGVTRSADVASIPVADFGYNQSEGTVVVEAKTFSNAEANHGDFALTDSGTSPDLISGSRTGSSVAGSYSTWYRTAGTTQANLVRTSTVEDNVFYKAGFCYKANDFAQSVDGGSILSDSSGTVPSRNSVVLIGDNYYGKLNGHIKSIKYFPRRLTNAQLVDLTS